MYFESGRKKECYGCKACLDICPVNAIHFAEDEEGFTYPGIDQNKCIHCNLCINNCSYGTVNGKKDFHVYAAWHKESTVRDASSSGGIFLPLALQILAEEGIISGAAFEADFSVKHIMADSVKELSRLQKSKYVQSDTETIYLRIKEVLGQGKNVLYSGTPCQIAAMKKFLDGKYEHIVFCEVLCYGVPSPGIYKMYLDYLQRTYRSRIQKIDFKDKRYGWDYYTTAIDFANGRKLCTFGGDSFKKMMHCGLSLRPACLECNYGLCNSSADISLGDFYNAAHYINDRAPKNGISCVIVRSNKGEQLFSKIRGELETRAVNLDDFLEYEKKKKTKINQNKQPEFRREFYRRLNTNGYEDVISIVKKKKTIKDRVMAFRLHYFYDLK